MDVKRKMVWTNHGMMKPDVVSIESRLRGRWWGALRRRWVEITVVWLMNVINEVCSIQGRQMHQCVIGKPEKSKLKGV